MLQLKKSVCLASLRQPLKNGLVTASRIGAEAVEINGWTEIRATEMTRTAIRHLRKMLADLNLRVSAIHFPTRNGYGVAEGLERRIDGTKAALKLAYDLGSNLVVNHIGRVPSDPHAPEWSTLVQALTDIGVYSQRAGAWLAARTGADSGADLLRLIQSLPPHSMMVSFDPGDLIIYGHSPNDAIKVLGSHVMDVRAKDAVVDLAQGRGLEVQLGRGSVDWPHLLGVLEEHNYQGFLTVDRNAEERSVEQCAMAMEYLTNLFC
jgi:sugar phosphate isomerase/epimerase